MIGHLRPEATMYRHTPCLALAFLFLAVSSCFPWSGKCVGISDGDTIKVMHLGKAEKIRLYGIDCPERGQDFGRVAGKFASDKAFGSVVEMKQLNEACPD